MKKIKVLSILCVGLVITNLAFIWFFVLHKPHAAKNEGPKKIIIEKLGLDKNQVNDYEKLIVWHRTEIKKTEEKLFELKNKLYKTILDNDSQNIKDSLIIQIGNSQTEMEHIHYKHFSDIKSLCKPNQLKSFEALVLEIASLFSHTRTK